MKHRIYSSVFNLLGLLFLFSSISAEGVWNGSERLPDGLFSEKLVTPDEDFPLPAEECFIEDFSDITAGNNKGTSGSNSSWDGNEAFPTIEFAYQAGGAVRLGNANNSGFIESRALDEVSGDIQIVLMVKGWTGVEGDLIVSIDGQEETVTYQAEMDDNFESLTINFSNVSSGSKLKIETSAKRVFIDEVKILCNGDIPCDLTVSISGDEEMCEGSSVELTASEGESYSWSTGETTQSITVSEAGEYSVTVTDGDGCEGSANHEVKTIEVPLPPVIDVADHACDSDVPGSISAEGCEGGTILWSTDQVTWVENAPQYGEDSFTVYAKCVAPNGCESEIESAVTNPADCDGDLNPEITNVIETDPTTCGAEGLIELTFANVPDGIYDITFDGGEFEDVVVENGSASIPAVAGEYNNLQIEVAGETSAEGVDAILSDPDGPVVPEVDIVYPDCDDLLGSAIVEGAVTAFTYTLTGPGASDVSSNHDGVFDNLSPGSYSLIVFDGSCESEPYDFTLDDPDCDPPIAEGTQAPNCSNFSPAINGNGEGVVSARDFLTNAENVKYPVTVSVKNQWGGVIKSFTFSNPDATATWKLCDYLDKRLEFSAKNDVGNCNRGFIDINGTPPIHLRSAWQAGHSDPSIGNNKRVVYCGNIPAPGSHRPTATTPCPGMTYTGPVAMPDWVEVNACGDNDTAEVILRHWEVTGQDGQRTVMTDTIIVMRLPKLTPGAFMGTFKDTVYCDIKSYVGKPGEDIYRYASWKQPVGLADFEQPYSGLGSIVYHIPGYVIEAGLWNACNQSTAKYNSYLNFVIMKNPDGSVVRIKDIITNSYINNVIANATPTQKGYGILNNIYEETTGLVDQVSISACGNSYSFYNYLFPKIGAEVLSENGTYETVTEEWFYNGTGNSPYWFSGGWPSIYGSGDCTTYCDVHGGKALEDKIRVRVPVLIADMDGLPYGEECMEINLSSNVNCGLKIVQDKKDEWVEFQNCVTERSVRSVVTQSCWANGIEYNSCADEDVEVGEDCYVEDYQDNERCCDRVVITLNNIQQMIDNQPPIFEFCYPTTWNQDEVMSSIRAGEQYEKAYDYEKSNYTVYRTSSHECGARVFVPDIQVMDNCSGLESVKAVLHDRAGNFERKVELKLTDTEIVNIGGGDRCTIYTYSHLSDPFYIPFEGCDVEPLEIVYNAFDGCNHSYWSKFIQVRDDIPPTVITDRDVNVTMTKDVEYAKAETYDEGSWDNCAIEKMLVRRTDWVSVVNLCANVKNLNSWKDILVAIGFNPTQVGTAVHGGTVGNPSIDISKLDNFLNTGEIELYYLSQIKKLWGEGGCSEKVVHGWLFDIARALADCDADNDLSATDLEFILDRLFAEAGYGHHVSYIGGGWAEMSPFTCDDACEVVPNELLVIDYCCNVGIGPSETHVIDNSQPRVAKSLPNLTVSCEAYADYLEDIVAAAAVYEDSDQDSTNAFDALDAALGGYLFVGFDNQGRPVGTDGSLLPDSVLTFEFKNVTCHDRGDGLELKTETEKGDHGIISTTCRGNLRQTVTVKIDECGLGTITRRFWVGSGCNGADAKEIFSQRITIESACPMTKSMFDVPENLGSVKEPVCLPREIATNNLLDTIGELKVKEELLGKLCNSIAVGHKVEVQKLVNYPDYVQYKITWIAVDWCCADDLPEREYRFVQKVIANIDPECTLDEGGDDEDISLVQGTIATEKGDAVGNVEMKAVLGSGSPMTMVTSGDGAYNFSIQDGSNVSLVPSKNTGFANGVTTHDLIYIQRHVLQKELLENMYQRIAADVDGNGRIDAYDVLELRQLVMRPDTELANNTSWRFFDKNTDKEVYEVSNLNGDVSVDWVGVKIGDVDLSGDATRSSRSTTGELTLTVADKQLKAGETYRVDVTSANFHEVMGMQYTLSYLKDQVDIESIEAGALNITENHYYRYAPGVITSSWSEADAMNLSSDEVLFTIVLKAKSAVQLRDVLSLNSRVTPVEAYAADGLKDVSLRFDAASEDGFALYQNTPNPYAGETTIGFHLPEASKATLSVYDVKGKMLKIVEGEFNQGYNEVKLIGSDLNTTGVLYYQLDTKTYTATKKMVVIE